MGEESPGMSAFFWALGKTSLPHSFPEQGLANTGGLSSASRSGHDSFYRSFRLASWLFQAYAEKCGSVRKFRKWVCGKCAVGPRQVVRHGREPARVGRWTRRGMGSVLRLEWPR